MKKIFLLPLLALLVGCSADNEDLLVPEIETQALDLQTNTFSSTAVTMTADYCGSATFPIGQYGDLEIKHDGFDIFVTITAREGYDLVDTKLHLVSGESSFPVVGQGNLPPGQMEHKYNFETGTDSFTFPAFDIADDLWGTYVSIASKTSFTDGVTTFSSWTGPVKGNSGNWSYLEYQIKTCCEMAYTGVDKELTITQEFYESSLGTAFWLRRYLLNNMLETGVVKSGTLSPTAGYLDQMYNDWSGQGGRDADLPYRENLTDEGYLIMRTTYTLGQGSCADQAVLTLYIIPTQPSTSTTLTPTS